MLSLVNLRRQLSLSSGMMTSSLQQQQQQQQVYHHHRLHELHQHPLNRTSSSQPPQQHATSLSSRLTGHRAVARVCGASSSSSSSSKSNRTVLWFDVLSLIYLTQEIVQMWSTHFWLESFNRPLLQPTCLWPSTNWSLKPRKLKENFKWRSYCANFLPVAR